MDYWGYLQGLLGGQIPPTGTYSTGGDERRFPSMVPGNDSLYQLIRMGYHPPISAEQFQRAAQYAQQTGNYKSESSPMSPLGSEFDFFNPSPARQQDLRAFSIFDLLK